MVYFPHALIVEYQLSRSTHSMTNKATIALTALSLAASLPTFAESSFPQSGSRSMGCRYKVNEVRRDSSTTGTFTLPLSTM